MYPRNKRQLPKCLFGMCSLLHKGQTMAFAVYLVDGSVSKHTAKTHTLEIQYLFLIFL